MIVTTPEQIAHTINQSLAECFIFHVNRSRLAKIEVGHFDGESVDKRNDSKITTLVSPRQSTQNLPSPILHVISNAEYHQNHGNETKYNWYHNDR